MTTTSKKKAKPGLARLLHENAQLVAEANWPAEHVEACRKIRAAALGAADRKTVQDWLDDTYGPGLELDVLCAPYHEVEAPVVSEAPPADEPPAAEPEPPADEPGATENDPDAGS
jgi:hypothetical protein